MKVPGTSTMVIRKKRKQLRQGNLIKIEGQRKNDSMNEIKEAKKRRITYIQIKGTTDIYIKK